MTGTMGENHRQSRPRRLHWTTVVVLLFMASFFGVWQVRGIPSSVRTSDGPRTGYWENVWEHGWPATFLTNYSAKRLNIRNGPWDLTTAVHRFKWVALAIDAAVCLALLCSTVIVVELLVRRRRLQFGIKSLLAVTAAVAVVLILYSKGFIEWENLIYIPVGFSFLCVIGMPVWLLMRNVEPRRLHRITLVLLLLTAPDIFLW